MSYTQFTYNNLRVDKTHFTADDVLTVQLDVTNTGNMTGKEAVLLYSSDLVASMVPDNKRLRAFQKHEIQPGETATVVFKLPAKDLAFVGADGRWILEEGDFQLKVGKEPHRPLRQDQGLGHPQYVIISVDDLWVKDTTSKRAWQSSCPFIIITQRKGTIK